VAKGKGQRKPVEWLLAVTEFFADGFQLQNGVEIAGAAHGALGGDEGVERQNMNPRIIKGNDLTLGQAFGKTTEALDLAQTVKLPPCPWISRDS